MVNSVVYAALKIHMYPVLKIYTIWTFMFVKHIKKYLPYNFLVYNLFLISLASLVPFARLDLRKMACTKISYIHLLHYTDIWLHIYSLGYSSRMNLFFGLQMNMNKKIIYT